MSRTKPTPYWRLRFIGGDNNAPVLHSWTYGYPKMIEGMGPELDGPSRWCEQKVHVWHDQSLPLVDRFWRDYWSQGDKTSSLCEILSKMIKALEADPAIADQDVVERLTAKIGKAVRDES